MLEEFQVYAGQRNIQPSVGEWAQERGWVQSRLKQEIFNQALGVAKGDEVEAQRDPAVRAAIERLVARLVELGLRFRIPLHGVHDHRQQRNENNQQYELLEIALHQRNPAQQRAQHGHRDHPAGGAENIER